MRKILLVTSSIIVLSTYSSPAQAWYHHYYGWGWGPAPVIIERGPVVVERPPIYVEPDPVVIHNARIDRVDELNRRIAHLENDKAAHPENTREDNIEIHALRKEIHRLYG